MTPRKMSPKLRRYLKSLGKQPPTLKRATLSDAEIQSLRRKAKETSAYFQKAFAHLKPSKR